MMKELSIRKEILEAELDDSKLALYDLFSYNRFPTNNQYPVITHHVININKLLYQIEIVDQIIEDIKQNAQEYGIQQD
jgi:hypothetical protein